MEGAVGEKLDVSDLFLVESGCCDSDGDCERDEVEHELTVCLSVCM